MLRVGLLGGGERGCKVSRKKRLNVSLQRWVGGRWQVTYGALGRVVRGSWQVRAARGSPPYL